MIRGGEVKCGAVLCYAMLCGAMRCYGVRREWRIVGCVGSWHAARGELGLGSYSQGGWRVM